MRDRKLYAVVTGDIVGSSKLKAIQRNHLLSALKSSFEAIENILPGEIFAPFEIHRGDSFQGVLSKPEVALRVIIVIRASVRYAFEIKRRRYALDAREVG